MGRCCWACGHSFLPAVCLEQLDTSEFSFLPCHSLTVIVWLAFCAQKSPLYLHLPKVLVVHLFAKAINFDSLVSDGGCQFSSFVVPLPPGALVAQDMAWVVYV